MLTFLILFHSSTCDKIFYHNSIGFFRRIFSKKKWFNSKPIIYHPSIHQFSLYLFDNKNLHARGSCYLLFVFFWRTDSPQPASDHSFDFLYWFMYPFMELTTISEISCSALGVMKSDDFFPFCSARNSSAIAWNALSNFSWAIRRVDTPTFLESMGVSGKGTSSYSE